MDHDKIDQAAGETGSSQAQVATRRRFLKGTSLALPAVMTLHSVSAQAQARSSAYCANDTRQAGFAPLTDEQDDYFRNSVAVYDTLVKQPAGSQKPYLGDGIIAFFAGTDSNGDSVIRDLAGNIVSEPLALDDPNNPTKSVNYPANPNYVPPTPAFANQLAIVLFDSQSGAVVSVGEPTTTSGVTMVTSLTGACLHSLWGQTV
jgi:hypothetical protein